jgi:hypothetical protein
MLQAWASIGYIVLLAILALAFILWRRGLPVLAIAALVVGVPVWFCGGMKMTRLAQSSFFVFWLFASVAHAAPITLNCSGAWWNTEENVANQPVKGLALVVDLDAKQVRGSYGEFIITDVTDSLVFFERPYQESDRTTGQMKGRVNRISGETAFEASRNGGKSFFIVYQLVCKPATLLF